MMAAWALAALAPACAPEGAETAAPDQRGLCDVAAPTAAAAGEGCARMWIDANIRLNDIQVLGTHNSYKEAFSPVEFELYSRLRPQSAPTLEYAHEPIPAQLDFGVRQLEIDVVHDPEGGRFLDPLLARMARAEGATVPPLAFRDELAEPGFKVLHVPDVDYRTSCATFVACLRQVRDWSQAHPDHAPILILLNPKDRPASLDGATPVLPFDAAAFDALDAEVLEVFPREAVITPEEVKGEHPTLREAVLNDAWPTLGEARGRVLFAILNGEEFTTPYRDRPEGLMGRMMFINVDQDDGDAAYQMWDDPIVNQQAIQDAVSAGFIVRTRTEQDTVEARANDTVKREAAFASGAQFVSTDYYKPNPDFGPFVVGLPGGRPAICNPLRTGYACSGEPVE
jgi:hypothetical protein